ncbi:MAG: DoxX family protein [Armatimonas sp.]
METQARYTYQQPAVQPISLSPLAVWTGRILSYLPALFLLMDGVMKLAKPAFVVEATTKMGFPESSILVMGILLTISTILYLIPRTAVLGAILLTGYLGGAVATHVRDSAPLFNNLFPVAFGVLLWGGLWLRDNRLRALIPLKSN